MFQDSNFPFGACWTVNFFVNIQMQPFLQRHASTSIYLYANTNWNNKYICIEIIALDRLLLYRLFFFEACDNIESKFGSLKPMNES